MRRSFEIAEAARGEGWIELSCAGSAVSVELEHVGALSYLR